MSNEKIVQLSPDKIKFNSIDEAITAIKNGGFIVVADDEGRENEGDLICAAANVTPEMVNFMAKEARGLICVSVTKERAESLHLNPMVEDNTDPHQTAFTVSVDAGPEFGVSTGISATDRAKTIRRLVNANSTSDDFRRPGHIFPVQAQTGGVLRRVGHTEAAIDFARLAGLAPMGVICEIMNDDGSMARRDDLAAFAKKHNLPFVTIAQLIAHRMEREGENGRFVVRKVQQEIETRYGTFTAVGYRDMLNGVEHLAMVKGSLDSLGNEEPLVRVQHEKMILDVLSENEEENLQQMAAAMTYINAEGRGVVVYLRSNDGMPAGLIGSLKSYAKRMTGGRHAKDPKMDLRDYGIGAQILTDLGIKQFRLITSNPKKIVALRGYGLEITDTVELPKGNYEFATQAETAPAPRLKADAPATKTEAKNENAKPAANTDAPKAEPKKEAAAAQEPRVMTMKMGGQIISNQALFEG